MSKEISLSRLNFRNQWILATILVFIAHIMIGLVIIMSLNGQWVNHSLLPIFQYTGMFSLIWPEQPFGAIQFLATKSLFAFAHHDPRSGLNLWTLEYDSITLLLYTCTSVFTGWMLVKYLGKTDVDRRPAILVAAFLGAFFLSFSASYMTVIEHCSGATWVGFVSLYGMGFDEFQLYPAYQFISAIIGILALAGGLIQIKSTASKPQP